MSTGAFRIRNDQEADLMKAPVTMNCSDDGCLTAAVMFGMKGVRILTAGEVGGELHLLLETTEQIEGCRSCGVVAGAHRRREHLLRDAPFGHGPWW